MDRLVPFLSLGLLIGLTHGLLEKTEDENGLRLKHLDVEDRRDNYQLEKPHELQGKKRLKPNLSAFL